MYPPAMNRILIAFAVAAVVGCASSPQGMEQPENATTFTVDQPYQLTLKRIVEADENCRRGPLLPIGQTINDVQHYPDLREAKIVQGASGIGRQFYQVTTVKEVGDASEVTVYAKSQRDERAATMKRWANGDPTCP